MYIYSSDIHVVIVGH